MLVSLADEVVRHQCHSNNITNTLPHFSFDHSVAHDLDPRRVFTIPNTILARSTEHNRTFDATYIIPTEFLSVVLASTVHIPHTTSPN